jgi:hypothetical protein
LGAILILATHHCQLVTYIVQRKAISSEVAFSILNACFGSIPVAESVFPDVRIGAKAETGIKFLNDS